MARIGARERQVVKILDANGTLLTAATAGALDEEGALDLDDVDDHGALIDFYFGRCERIVIVEHDGTALEGTLDTQWQTSARAWWVGISQTAAARVRASIEDPEATLPREAVAAREDTPPAEPLLDDTRMPATLVG